jgi:DNA-binding NtrC family response regulator
VKAASPPPTAVAPVSRPRILIVDDDRAFRVGTGALLADEGYDVEAVPGGAAGLARLREESFDMVLLDLRMEGRTGLSVLEELRGAGNDIPVLMLTGYATVDSAVAALKLGADDYLTKPCDNQLLRAKIRSILARREPVLGPGGSRLAGTSPRLREVRRAIARVAPTESTVLLRGATGTGKELIARALHEESPRRSQPFLAVNCSSLSEGILESELFGHARGSFTGAVQDRKGLFEEASGGTLFLDEVGDVSAGMQSKLLRVLQEREVVRVGTSRTVPVDVRVIAATHRDLEAMVEDGSFRKDLYFRLKVFQIRVPELRERVEDIGALAAAAVARWNERSEPSRRITGVSEEALELMRGYDWPGNVRELMGAVEYAAIVSEGGRILAHHLPEEIREAAALAAPAGGERRDEGRGGESRRYVAPDAASEREAILQALEEAKGNRTRAAAALGMGRTTLWQKLKEYEI